MRIPRIPFAIAVLTFGLAACTETDVVETEKIVEVIPDCSTTYPTGKCDAGETCFQGACVVASTLCSVSNPTGICQTGYACYGGGCILESAVPPSPPAEIDCTAQVYTAQPTLAFAPGKPLGTGGAPYTYDDDADTATPAVEVPYVQKAAITVSGLQFRDLSGDGALQPYEDWRLKEICRARDLVTRMTVPQKVGLMNSGGTLGNGSTDGVISASIVQGIASGHRRQGLTRFGFTPNQSAVYFNNIQAMVEGLPLGIPAIVSADPVHSISASMANDGTLSISTRTNMTNWTSTLGLGAINDVDLTRSHGACVRREFMAQGLRWQLGPMADTSTEPRWGRVPGTLGSEPQHVARHVEAMVIGFQGSATGDLRNGIAATMKHFPGHGAQEEGMDAHTYQGRFNVYPGDNLEAHFIPFQAAFDVGAAAIMPCYSVYKEQYEYDPLQIPSGFSYETINGLAKGRLGFTGMVTADWGTASGMAFGIEGLTAAERAALWVKAGSHQYGSDSNVGFQQAHDQGLLTDPEIDEAAAKILEMTFKVGAFENPYTDTTNTATIVRTPESRTEGFESMKRAIVLLRNQDHVTSSLRYLPINGTRYTDRTGGTAGAPDVGEFHCDSDGDGQVEVYYDGAWDSIVGPTAAGQVDDVDDVLGHYDYSSAGTGTPGTAGFTLPVVSVAAIADADIAVLRIVPRGSARTWEGMLSYDGLVSTEMLGNQIDNTLPAAHASKKKVLDALRVRDGYVDAAGTPIAATKPTLKIVLVQQTTRPAIVKPFIQGMKTLNERAGCNYAGTDDQKYLCYPVISDEANIVQAPPFNGVDAFLADFGAWDRAVLDFVFNKNVPAGFPYGTARLPIEIPSTDAAVRAQYEDVPNDSSFPTYYHGAGSLLPPN